MSFDVARRCYYAGDMLVAVTALWACHSEAVKTRDPVAVRAVIALAQEIDARDPRSDAAGLLKVAKKSLTSLGGNPSIDREVADNETLRNRRDQITETAGLRDLFPRSTFEYQVAVVDPEEADSHLSKMGSLGWDLVSVTSDRDGRQRLY